MARPASQPLVMCIASVATASLAALLLAVGPAGAQTSKINVTARVSGAVDNGAVSVRASCNRGCASMRGTGTLSAKRIGRVVLVPAVKRLSGGSVTLALKIPASARSKVRKALANGERVTASLSVSGLDASGRPLVTASGRVKLGS